MPAAHLRGCPTRASPAPRATCAAIHVGPSCDRRLPGACLRNTCSLTLGGSPPAAAVGSSHIERRALSGLFHAAAAVLLAGGPLTVFFVPLFFSTSPRCRSAHEFPNLACACRVRWRLCCHEHLALVVPKFKAKKKTCRCHRIDTRLSLQVAVQTFRRNVTDHSLHVCINASAPYVPCLHSSPPKRKCVLAALSSFDRSTESAACTG